MVHAMETVIGLVGAIAGGALVLAGQYLARRQERRDRRSQLLFENCVRLIAIEEDFRGRVWNERCAGAKDQVDSWNAEGFRIAEASVGILTTDSDLLAALHQVRESGKQLGAKWRLDQRDSPALERLTKEHRAALDAFITASRAKARP